jgi:hypothetical protein
LAIGSNPDKGTQFRQLATRVLRDHIVKGYSLLNEQRFREQAEKLTEMRQTVELLARTLANQELVSETGKDVLQEKGRNSQHSARPGQKIPGLAHRDLPPCPL